MSLDWELIEQSLPRSQERAENRTRLGLKVCLHKKFHDDKILGRTLRQVQKDVDFKGLIGNPTIDFSDCNLSKMNDERRLNIISGIVEHVSRCAEQIKYHRKITGKQSEKFYIILYKSEAYNIVGHS